MTCSAILALRISRTCAGYLGYPFSNKQRKSHITTSSLATYMSDREEMELLELSFTHFGNGYPRSKYRRIWPLVPSFHLPARKQPFPRWFLPFSTLPSQVRHCHLPLESPLLARAGYPRRMMVHFSWHAGTRVAPDAGKPLRFCLECRCRAWANPTIGPARRLFPPPAQVLPIVIPPSCATLVVGR